MSATVRFPDGGQVTLSHKNRRLTRFTLYGRTVASERWIDVELELEAASIVRLVVLLLKRLALVATESDLEVWVTELVPAELRAGALERFREVRQALRATVKAEGK